MKHETFTSTHAVRILEHYARAREQHPYFCDWAGPDPSEKNDRDRVLACLAKVRERVADAVERRGLGWDDLLDCEVWEVFDAQVRGDKSAAVEELYDAIAVLLRTIDVLEGRQKLGRPEKEAEG